MERLPHVARDAIRNHDIGVIESLPMALTKAQIEALYSRLPMLRPPPSVFVLANADMGAQNLYDATHRLNAMARDQVEEKYHILGMHQMGSPSILIAGDAPEMTALHEAVHFQGIRSEPATRVITKALYARSKFNLGLRSRPVSYNAVPVEGTERDAFLKSMHLSATPGDARNVELIHLQYAP